MALARLDRHFEARNHALSFQVENVKRVVAVIGRAHVPGVLYALKTDKGELRQLFDHLVRQGAQVRSLGGYLDCGSNGSTMFVWSRYNTSEPLLGRGFGLALLAGVLLAATAAWALLRMVLTWAWGYLKTWYAQVVAGGPGAGAIPM